MTYKQLTDQYGSNATLYQGDCLELMKDIPDHSIDMILCDLPYGTTACPWDSIIPFEPLWKQYNRLIKSNGAILLTASQPFTTKLIASNIKQFKYCWYWEKSKGANFALTGFQPLKVIEDVVVFSNGACTYTKNNSGMVYNPQKVLRNSVKRYDHTTRNAINPAIEVSNKNISIIEYTHTTPRNLIYASTDGDGRYHPTQKPVALMEYLIKTYTNETQTVLDNCMGSGTTGVACINTKRNFIGIEQEQKYFDISVSRISDTIDDQKPDLTLEFS